MIKIPKINSIHFGAEMIVFGIIVGALIPGIIWLITGKVFWCMIILGIIILALFGLILAIEMHQDNGREPYYEKNLRDTIPYNPDIQYAVIKASICTGEQVAGFKNKESREFVEVMLIKSPADEERFKKIYGITDIKKEY